MAQGTIVDVRDRNYNGTTFYSVKLSDGQFYGFGSAVPPAVGTQVEFNTVTNKKGFVDADTKSLVILGKPSDDVVPTTPTPAKTYTKGGFNRGGFKKDTAKDDYWLRKEERDIVKDKSYNVGASRNTAIAWIKLLLDSGAISLPKTKAEQEDFLVALLQDYSEKFMVTEAVESQTHAEVEATAVVLKKDENGEW